MSKGIRQFLIEHAAAQPISFHMPGHKGSRIYRENGYGDFLDMVMDCDITEIPGADNLFQTESIIAQTMEKYRKLYEAKKSYLLVNGSSGGLIAAILATAGTTGTTGTTATASAASAASTTASTGTTGSASAASAAGRGGKLIMARNCHKSVFNALALGDITPVYAYPETLGEFGVLGGIGAGEIARLLDENPDAQAVILPSPNYYGICSDIAKIAAEVHRRGKILIVDQAHGAHLKFFSQYGIPGFPKPAEEQGADIVINSVHKTLASWTQSAILNICTDRVNLNVLEDKLQAIESSSPSYPMMASLDISADLLLAKGEKLIGEWAESLAFFYERVKKIPGLTIMETPSLDRTKLNIDMSAYDIDGNKLEELLMEKGIFIELVTGNIIMCMSGIGNTRDHYEKLAGALSEIAAERKLSGRRNMRQPDALTDTLEMAEMPKTRTFLPIDEAAGRVCASSIIPYPPGVPIACPGEILTREVLDYVKARRLAGEKVIGITAEGMVCVGK